MQEGAVRVTVELAAFYPNPRPMLAPLYVRPLTNHEREALEQGLRSKEAFTLRRCQILLASAKSIKASEIAALVGCSVQTIRNTIRAFEQHGLVCLTAQSNRPKTVHQSSTPTSVNNYVSCCMLIPVHLAKLVRPGR